MNFGLEWLIPGALYLVFLTAALASIFWRPIVGLYLFVPLVPLQTIRYRIVDFPLGASLVYVLLVAVALGLLRRGQSPVPSTPWTRLLCTYMAFTFVSLCLGALYLNTSMPWESGDQRLADWCDYMTMPALFLLTTAAVTDVRQIRILVGLMCVSVLMLDKSFWNTVSGHDFSVYSEDLREGGTMGYAGSNGLAAFEAQFATLLLALSATCGNWRGRLGYLALAGFSAICLMYSLSRGGYLAFAAGWLFVGLLKDRKLLLILAVFALTWTAVVPNAVQTRVTMTYDENGDLDHSSQNRVRLWDDALLLIQANPIIGTGYDTYRYMGRVGNYEDTHNIYLKILVETGVIGLLLFLGVMAISFCQGLRLFLKAVAPLDAGLGLGLAGWVVCAAVANAFGDRWTYLQIEGLFWVLAALVARSQQLQSAADQLQPAQGDVPEETAATRAIEALAVPQW